MNTSVSVYYPIDRAPARRDLATGALVSLAILAGVFWYGQAAKRGYIPLTSPSHHDQVLPLPPPIDVVDLQTEDTAPAPDTAPGRQVPMLQDVPLPPQHNVFVQPVEPTQTRITVSPRALTAPPSIGAGPGSRVYDPAGLDEVPVATFQPAPNYPYALKRAAVSGTVLIDFIVETNGTTSHVMVSGGQSEFGESAVQAVSRWRFHPGRKLGRSVRTHMVVPVRFTLETEQ